MSDLVSYAVFGRMFDIGTDAHFIVDPTNGGIVSANVRMAELLGGGVGELIGRTLAQIAFESRDVSRDGLYDHFALRRADGRPVFVSLHVMNVVDIEPGRDVIAYTARDTVERVLLEKDLIAKHSALFSAHADLEAAYRELRDTQTELESKNHEIATLAYQVGVSELVGSVAHHLNNPLGALHSMIRAVNKQVSELPPEHRGELDRRIRRITNIAGQIESNVNAIVTAGRSSKRTALPPELAAAIEEVTANSEGSRKGQP